MTETSVLEFESGVVTLEQREVLRGVDLATAPDQVVVLAGRHGAG